MAYDITDAATGQALAFKYRDFGVGGRPFVTIEEHRIPVVAFLGLTMHHLMQKFPEGDMRARWLAQLDKVDLVPFNDASWRLDFTRVKQAMKVEAPTSLPHPHERSWNKAFPGSIKSNGEPFVFASFKIAGKELIEALEYFFNNYPFQTLHDVRFEFFRGLLPAWDPAERWAEAEKQYGARGDSRYSAQSLAIATHHDSGSSTTIRWPLWFGLIAIMAATIGAYFVTGGFATKPLHNATAAEGSE